MSFIYVVGFGDTGRIKVGYSAARPERRVEAHKRGARAYLALKGLLGEEGVHFLEFGLHPDYALPVGPILTGGVNQDDVARVREGQEDMGLGMSYLEIMAGIVINRIRMAVSERRCQAFEADRLDLASRDYLFAEVDR